MSQFWDAVLEKLNPAQPSIADDAGGSQPTTQTNPMTMGNAFSKIEVVNRGINMLIDSAAQVSFDVADKLSFTPIATGVRKVTLERLLNSRPNPYMDISAFRRLLYRDMIFDGNCFIYYDGHSLYYLPAASVQVVPDTKTWVNSYVYNDDTTFQANEIIHVKDNSLTSPYRGDSRLNSALDSILKRESMLDFQQSFFDNGAAIGVVLETDAVLGTKFKQRLMKELQINYNPRTRGGAPLILDAGIKASTVANTNFREMDFNSSIEDYEKRIAVALGIPPLLFNSGNNANIRPNVDLFYSMTILPMMSKFEAAYEMFFAYDIDIATHHIAALAPDAKIQADRVTSLVNNGILIGNEGREILRLEPILDDENMNTIRIPANIAGSATGVSGEEGGAPLSKDKT